MCGCRVVSACPALNVWSRCPPLPVRGRGFHLGLVWMRLEKPPGGPGAREEAPAGRSGVGVVGTQTSVRTVGDGPLVTREQAEARAPAAFGGAAFSGHTWRAHLCRREGWASALCTGSSPCCWPQVWNATLEMTPRGPTHTQGTGRGRACPVQGPGERWPASVRPGSKLAAPSPAMTCVAVPGPSARGPAWRPRVPTALVGRPAPTSASVPPHA